MTFKELKTIMDGIPKCYENLPVMMGYDDIKGDTSKEPVFTVSITTSEFGDKNIILISSSL